MITAKEARKETYESIKKNNKHPLEKYIEKYIQSAIERGEFTTRITYDCMKIPFEIRPCFVQDVITLENKFKNNGFRYEYTMPNKASSMVSIWISWEDDWELDVITE